MSVSYAGLSPQDADIENAIFRNGVGALRGIDTDGVGAGAESAFAGAGSVEAGFASGGAGTGAGACTGSAAHTGSAADTGGATDTCADDASVSSAVDAGEAPHTRCVGGYHALEPRPLQAQPSMPLATQLPRSAYSTFTRGSETLEDVMQGDVLLSPRQPSTASSAFVMLHSCQASSVHMELLLSNAVVPITAAQKTLDWFILRRFRVTSSVAALFFRLTTDRTSQDSKLVWANLAQKWFDTRRFGSTSTRAAFRIGRLNEEPVVAYLPAFLARHQVHVKLSRDVGLVANRSQPWLAASPDQIVLLSSGSPCTIAGVEIKTATTSHTRDKLHASVRQFGAYVQYAALMRVALLGWFAA